MLDMEAWKEEQQNELIAAPVMLTENWEKETPAMYSDTKIEGAQLTRGQGIAWVLWTWVFASERSQWEVDTDFLHCG